MGFDQEEFYQFILDHRILQAGSQFRLDQGRISEWGLDWTKVQSDVYSTQRLVDFVLDFVQDKDLQPHCFVGVPNEATTIGMFIQYAWAQRQPHYRAGSHTLPQSKRQGREHGYVHEKLSVENVRGKTAIIDAGCNPSHIANTVRAVQEAGAEPYCVLALTDRDEGRKRDTMWDVIKEEGKFSAMSTGLEILKRAKDNPGYISSQVENAIDEYYSFIR